MRRPLRSVLLLAALVAPTAGCATIAGTAVSPITGGVDLVVQALPTRQWYWAPFVFIGGAISGPFVAFYNGVNYDAQVFKDFDQYWAGFDEVFRPFDMIGL